ncbi:hypothetical protein KDL45_01155 [bacterium]|nr:hypothetical protein [bacterium]
MTTTRSNKGALWRALTVAVALGLLAAGCAKQPPSAAKPMDLPADTDFGGAIVARAKPYTAMGKVKIEGANLPWADADILVHPEQGVRIDAFSPVMTPIASVALRPNGAEFLNFRNLVLTKGDPAAVTEAMLGVPMDTRALPWLLAGSLPPMGDGWHLQKMRPGMEAGEVLMQAYGEDVVYDAIVVRETGAVRRFEARYGQLGSGDPYLTVELSAHDPGEIPVPHDLRLVTDQRPEALLIHLKKIDFSDMPLDIEFVILPNNDTHVIDLNARR